MKRIIELKEINRVIWHFVFALRTFFELRNAQNPPRLAELSLRGVFVPGGVEISPRKKTPFSEAFEGVCRQTAVFLRHYAD